MEHQTLCNTCEMQVLSLPSPSAVKKLLSNGVLASGVARSLVLTGHLLYASPLASSLRALRVRLCDMHEWDEHGRALARHVPIQAQPSLHHWF